MAEERRETLTFVFTDIEGSTRLLDALGDRYRQVLEEHRRIISEAIAAGGGKELGTEGDSFFAVFDSAAGALAAVAQLQRELAEAAWPDDHTVKVRAGLHTGEAIMGPLGPVGIDVHRAARIAAAGHGGQSLLSATTRALIEHHLPDGVTLRDLGEHRLKDLTYPEHLWQLVVPGLPDTFPPLRSLDAAPNNLPVQLTSFVGRGQEVAQARDLLTQARLLTLLGPGGTGKTRLALQLAAESLEQYPDGVWFVALAPVTDPGLVASTVLSSLGLHESGGESPRHKLLEHLRDKRLLLVLDNFEQILDASPLVGEVLHAAPGVRVVATSRAALHLSGEQEYWVPPLAVPGADAALDPSTLSQYEAVSLFAQRAMAVKPDFRITQDNAAAIAEICARLDGLPLAIELAAARVKLLPPQALLSRLAAGLDVLASQARDLPPRQRTLRGAIAWSHDLLDEPARLLFQRLSAFRGSFGLEEAEAVCAAATSTGPELADVLAGLEELVDHSLLRQVELAGEPRFVMLETIREYAVERLEQSGEAAEVRSLHVDVYLELAETSEPRLMGPEGGRLLDRMERELDNFRAALDHAVATDCPRSLRLGASLWRMWQMRGHLHEGRARLERIVAAEAAAQHPALLSRALEALGGVAYWQADMVRARDAYEGSLAIERERGDERRVADGLYNLAFTYFVGASGGIGAHDYEQAGVLLQEALGIYERLGDELAAARALWALAGTTYEHAATLDDQGQPEAREFFEQSRDYALASLVVFKAHDHWFDAGWALHEAGIAQVRLGELDDARTLLLEGLELFVEHRDVSGILLLLDDLADYALRRGREEDGLRLRGAAERMRHESGTELAQLINEAERRFEQLDARGRAALEEGAAMGLDQVIALARSL